MHENKNILDDTNFAGILNLGEPIYTARVNSSSFIILNILLSVFVRSFLLILVAVPFWFFQVVGLWKIIFITFFLTALFAQCIEVKRLHYHLWKIKNGEWILFESILLAVTEKGKIFEKYPLTSISQIGYESKSIELTFIRNKISMKEEISLSTIDGLDNTVLIRLSNNAKEFADLIVDARNKAMQKYVEVHGKNDNPFLF